MKIPARAKKCLDYLDILEMNLEFYLPKSSYLRDLKLNEIQYLRDYISEISEAKKLSDIKLAVKIKKEMDE